MPLYEYHCARCERTFEVIQKFSDAPLETCQSCGGAVTKLLSSPAIQFKGAGWYITDYSRKSGGGSEEVGSKPEKSESAETAKEGSQGEGTKGTADAASKAPAAAGSEGNASPKTKEASKGSKSSKAPV